MTFTLTGDMFTDITQDRNAGASWRRCAAPYGVSGPVLRRAYLAYSRELYYPAARQS